MAVRSAVLLLVAAAATVGAVAIIANCREGTSWDAMAFALLTGSASAIALAAFLQLRQRAIAGTAAALLLAGAYGAIALAAIQAADVGGNCFH
ncbi:MAG: hypothetical protein H0U03_10010 [Actinobacteria bacterium]|nr:hypothetical protein [Actinomycetota bacterium]